MPTQTQSSHNFKKNFFCCFLKQDLVVFSPGMPQLELATFLLPQLSNSGIIDVRSPVPHRSSTVFPTDVTQSFRRVQSGCGNSPCALWGICSQAHTDVLCSVMGLLTLGLASVWLPAVQGSSCLALAVSSVACQASEIPYFFLGVLETHRTSGLQSQAHLLLTSWESHPCLCPVFYMKPHLTPFFRTLCPMC